MERKVKIVLWCALMYAHSLFPQDKFAKIATQTYQTREHLLVTPQAPELPGIILPAEHKRSSMFRAKSPIATKEELYQELAKMRERHRPFLRDLAPKAKAMRRRQYLETFDWRVGTAKDSTDFFGLVKGQGTWEEVSIPHYGPPLGRAVTYYRKEMDLDETMLSPGSLFLHFKGVDYKASVFVNGTYVGSHEGFFAPFEFDIIAYVRQGKNTILVKVENDYPTTQVRDNLGNKVIGDKIYAATGPGYDDPKLGWHHGPAGMGIYQDCYLEARSPLHIHDIFVRPMLEDSVAEVWVEVNNFEPYASRAKLKLSVYGQNFDETVIENLEYIPSFTYVPGVGDLAKPTDHTSEVLTMGYGVNYLKIPLHMKGFRLWDGDNPWLYQVQIKLYDDEGKHTDTQVQPFGMRSFTMDTVNLPKGKMYLNGKMIRLRGANTMGNFQQCVMKKDWDQLIDDILLAKLANMNFIRFTQRPVQQEIYDYCDQLGMMHQVDLPFFGTVRRNKFAEAVKQAEEMERLVRSHPSAIMATYINERFPNGEGNPHRSLNTAKDYHHLFKALDQAILLSNPDRIIKAGDGDYDPPSPGLPDNHCYNIWYNGHGLGLGEMYKGQWQPVKPGWLYACGEFGAEGLDPVNTMKKYYPESWLPQNPGEEKKWNANRIAMAQTNKFHYMWYNTQYSLADWVNASQDYQAWGIQFVTETFRRDPGMVSFAVHLFIDAWPAGWMKSIMDVDRQPKKAYFAYRNALEPLMVSLRSDRRHFFENEETEFELWIANDLNEIPGGYILKYQVESKGKVVLANEIAADIPSNSAQFQGFLKYNTPKVKKRTKFLLRAGLFDTQGKSVYQNTFDFEVFPRILPGDKRVYVLGQEKGNAARIITQANLIEASSMEDADVILVDNFSHYKEMQKEVDAWVSRGKLLLFLNLTAGNYTVANTQLKVEKTNMGDYYFVSPATGHQAVHAAEPFDFRFWYHGEKRLIAPILSHTVQAPRWSPILLSGLSNWGMDKGHVQAAGELRYGEGAIRFSQVQLVDRLEHNPTALRFLYHLLAIDR